MAAISLQYLPYSVRGSTQVSWSAIFQEKCPVICGFSERKIMLPRKENRYGYSYNAGNYRVCQKILSCGV